MTPALPLAGLLVVDLSQFLSGSYASLRLQDLGARVIKIERPDGGDLCRRLYFSDLDVDGESTIFHAINRGKESLSLDLKSERDAERLRKLLRRADVMIQNFRVGVIDRLGFGYKTVAALNPRLVYASISGYGSDGPWAHLPGQDLLAQARAGIMWLSGNAGDGPVPMGLAVADIMAGSNTAHGILAALVQRGTTGQGAHIETSLLEAMIDLQFEVLAMYCNDGGHPPQRAASGSAHVALSAPYGVYETKDGHLAIAMTPLDKLAGLLDSDALRVFAQEAAAWFQQRDAIKAVIAQIVSKKTTAHWLTLLAGEGVWCAPVLSWQQLFAEESFHRLEMVQSLPTGTAQQINLMRSPIRINGGRGRSARAAPAIGADNERLLAEFDL